MTSILDNENVTITTSLELFKKFVEQFNERVRVNNNYYDNIITLLKSRFNDIDSVTNSIYDRINTFDRDTKNLIIAEHRLTRNEITKQAKIISKINSKTKTSKSINK